jgi:GDP-D-mannose dehydratase
MRGAIGDTPETTSKRCGSCATELLPSRGSAELGNLVGDPSRAKDNLGRTPGTSFEQLIRMPNDADLERLGPSVEPGPSWSQH